MTPNKGPDWLALKWGTLKACELKSKKAIEALRKYEDEPTCMSAMAQRDTATQKHALCELIDAIDGEIYNDWSGETLTKDEAKKYVMEYGNG